MPWTGAAYNQQKFIFTVLEAGKSKNEARTDLFLVHGLCPGYGRRGKGISLRSFFVKELIPFMRNYPMT